MSRVGGGFQTTSKKEEAFSLAMTVAASQAEHYQGLAILLDDHTPSGIDCMPIIIDFPLYSHKACGGHKAFTASNIPIVSVSYDGFRLGTGYDIYI